MRKYDSYKNSGIDWIGEIPSHWEMKKFGSISYMKGRIGWQGLKQAEFTSNPEDPFLVTGMNFHDGKIRWNEVYHILEERYNEAPEIQLKESDVLFTKDGTIGKLLYIDSIPYPHKASLNSHLLVLRPFNNLYKPRFLFYQLESLPFKHHIELTKTGTTFYGITQEAMGQYKALLPTSEEQVAIAHYLDRKTAEIDELIVDKKRLLELYEEEKTAVINQAVTKGINLDVPMKDSGIEWLGEIPEHWGVPNMKYVCEFILDGTHGSFARVESGYRLLSVRNIINDQFVFRDDDSKVSEKDFYEISKRFLIQLNDIQLAIVGATLGKVAIVKALPEPFVTQRSVATLRANEKCIPEYLFYFLKSSNFQSFLWLNAGFSAQPGIYLGTIQNSSMPLPDIEEQQNIVNRIKTECDRINSKKSKTQKLIELLTEYRTALISEVVTGKVKVN